MKVRRVVRFTLPGGEFVDLPDAKPTRWLVEAEGGVRLLRAGEARAGDRIDMHCLLLKEEAPPAPSLYSSGGLLVGLVARTLPAPAEEEISLVPARS